jgi:hypothetical protein
METSSFEASDFRHTCIGHSRSDPRKPCGRQAEWFCAVCYSHGARRRMVQVNGVKRWVTSFYEDMMKTYGEPVIINPTEGLLEEVYRTHGHILWLGERLSEVLPDELAEQIWSFKRSTEVPSGARETLEALQNQGFAGVWMDLYLKERAHFAKLCQTAMVSDLEERRLQLDEKIAEQFATAVTGILEDLGLDPNDPRVREKVYMRMSQAGARMQLVQGKVEE